MVELEREVDGGKARFRVVRAEAAKMPEGRIQFVEQLTPELLWRESEVNALSLRAVFVVADDVVETAARWARFAALLPYPEDDVVRLKTERGSMVIGSREAIAQRLGSAPAAPAIAGYALACAHPDSFAERCSAAGVRVTPMHKQYAAQLPASLGGAWLFG